MKSTVISDKAKLVYSSDSHRPSILKSTYSYSSPSDSDLLAWKIMSDKKK